MTPAEDYTLVLVTVPSLETARQLACDLLEERLAACINIIAGVESHYWWKGQQESSHECLLLIKTDADRLEALERKIVGSHPYEIPEILAVRLHRGLEKYLRWIDASLVNSPELRSP